MHPCNHIYQHFKGNILVKQRASQSGFTLIEFIIALTILGILTSFAVPAFVRYTETYRIDSIQRNFASAFKLAQSEAIKSNHQGVLCIAAAADDTCDTGANADWQQGWYVFEDVNNNGVIDLTGATPDVILKFQAPISKINFVSNTNSLTFNGSGAIVGGEESFSICIDRPVDDPDCNSEQTSEFITLASGQFIFQ